MQGWAAIPLFLFYNSLFILRIIQKKILFETLELRKRHTAYTNLDENIERGYRYQSRNTDLL